MQVLGERTPGLLAHVSGVTSLVGAVAEDYGLDSETTDEVLRAAELHDIGKLAIPDEIQRPDQVATGPRRERERHQAPSGPIGPSAHRAGAACGHPEQLDRGVDIRVAERVQAVPPNAGDRADRLQHQPRDHRRDGHAESGMTGNANGHRTVAEADPGGTRRLVPVSA